MEQPVRYCGSTVVQHADYSIEVSQLETAEELEPLKLTLAVMQQPKQPLKHKFVGSRLNLVSEIFASML